MKTLGNIFIFLFLLSFCLSAQGSISLTGTLLDKADNQSIISGSVELLAAKDGARIAAAISDKDGVFSFKNLSKGNYEIKATYIGYLPVTKKVVLTDGQPSVNVGKLYMESNDILLAEAVVEGKRPEIIVKNDTIEYDAASYKVAENAVVEDLLKKMPGVEIDEEGKITVNGKEVKRFMVDGKEFFSDDPQVASKNLPAEMIEKLQVLDRRSDMAMMTGFDDGEEETIINLTVKPGMKQGTMGNALLGSGTDVQAENDWRYQGGAFVNHMRNNDRYTLILGTNNNNNMGAGDLGANQFGGMRMRRGSGGIAETTNFMLSMNKELSSVATLNGDVRFTGSDRNSISKVEQTTFSEVRSQLDKINTSNDYLTNNLSANFTFEWKPDTLNTLIVRPNFRYNRSESDEQEFSTRFDYNTNDSIFDSESYSRNKGDGYQVGGTVDYAHKFHKPGRVFSFNASGSYNDSYSQENSFWRNRQFENGIYADLEEETQRAENDNASSNFQATVSWVEPLGRSNFLQALYRVSYYDTQSINSTYDMFDEVDDVVGYAEINPDQSRSTLRNSTEQRFGLNFKAVREKYNYTIGFNVDPTKSTNETYQPSDENFPIQLLTAPYDSRLANILGDSLVSSIKQNVINFSPVLNFNYIFGQRSNLRIDYEGKTNQPSASQLRDYVDTSRPTDLVQGNPALKPGYTNNIRIRFNKYVADTQLMYNLGLNGGFSFNDITSITGMAATGERLTTYDNINGNWNVNFRGMFNMPLRNKRFTIANFLMTSYRNQNSYVGELERNPLSEKIEVVGKTENTMRNLSIRENLRFNYRSDLFDAGLNVSFRYNNISYTSNTQNNQNTYNYGVGANTTWYLPHNLVIESDINFMGRGGYADGYNIPETIWNAAVTKQLFNKKFGTGSLKLQIYDILQDRNNITASSTTNGYRTSEVNVIPSYFMCSFIYKFTLFPKSSSAKESDFQTGNDMRPGGRGGFGGPRM